MGQQGEEEGTFAMIESFCGPAAVMTDNMLLSKKKKKTTTKERLKALKQPFA